MDEIVEEIKNLSASYKFDPKLIYAFCKKESNFNILAIRFEPQWRYATEITKYLAQSGYSYDTERILQSCSWGLMQIMGTNLRNQGYKDSLLKMSQDWKACLEFSMQKLNDLRARYPWQNDMIASWNAGSPIKVANNRYFNQNYVDSVNAFVQSCPTL